MQDDIIQVEMLKKSYGDVHAVKDISFSVRRGSLFSFLGVNGAGKSTTINILCSILTKDDGHVRICGFDLDESPREIARRIGVVFQGGVLDDGLSVRDNLKVRAGYYGLYGAAGKRRIEELSALLSLDDLLNRPYGKLSGGQRRRADIARGLINRPDLLILDEPTTGLDPQTRRTVWDIMERLRREQGLTVFLTTHYMEEADASDHVVMIDGGRIVASDTPVALKNKYSRHSLRLYGDAEALSKGLQARGVAAEHIEGGVRLFFDGAAAALAFLEENRSLCNDFEFIKGSMDDVFLAVTGRHAEGGDAV